MRDIGPNQDARGSQRGWRLLPRIDSRRARRASLFLVGCWLFLNASPRALSQNEEGVEYPVKLAFLYNFTKFVEWPADSYSNPGAPLSICIVGRDPFSSDIEGELQTRKAWGHPVQVLTLRPNQALSACHMVFIPVTEKDQAGKVVR